MEQPVPNYIWEDHPQRLEWKDFVPVGRKLKKGTSMRFNHDSIYCSGDSDSLTIRRTPAGMIFGKCFRCGRFGVFKNDMEVELPNKVDGRWFKIVSFEEVQNKPLELPKDLELQWDKWPIEARSYLRHARIDEVVAFVRNIGYSPSLGKVVLPLYSYQSNINQTTVGSELIGYQLRRVFKEDTSPKYTTRKNVKDYFAHVHKTERICCIVEDYLSYIRCGKFVSTVCLFGTNLPLAVIKALARYDRVIIFLDNDNNIVKKKQLEMQRELESWIDEVIIIGSSKQPKEYTDAELVQTLDVPF